MSTMVSPLSLLHGNLPADSRNTKIDKNVPFGDYLKNVLHRTDQLQKEADQAVQALAAGNLDNLHDVMIVAEQAQLSLQLTVQVVNKVIQAYQEVYRMQI